MKKHMCVLCLVIVVIILPTLSLADGCDYHQKRYAVIDSYQYSYSYINNNDHLRTETVYYHCEFCMGAGYLSTWTEVNTGAENHVVSSTWYGEHLQGTTWHMMYHFCNKCQHNWTDYYHCPGNPCIFPQNLNPAE